MQFLLAGTAFTHKSQCQIYEDKGVRERGSRREKFIETWIIKK